MSTDFDESDRLYFEELSHETVLDIVDGPQNAGKCSARNRWRAALLNNKTVEGECRVMFILMMFAAGVSLCGVR